ncbi:hypothetical protein [Sabulibacter ruber]|uniref:hypothetical protein n=1 Tax=Sabulibacter ruber TaxID=2811901 RepID=UPI001A95F7B7|nr:hypothetical protein [Sabulibacter ruber]
MKRLKSILSLILLGAFIVTACQDDDHELGRMLSPEEISIKVVQDLSIDPGGNTVILINETPETISMWDFETGRSTRTIDTVRYAFAGDYTIKFSAVTGGGIVELPAKTITVTQNNLNYVNDPLWTALSGGPGNEKTWILDIDANHFDGPLYFYGTDNGWGGACTKPGGDCWNWNPDYKGNTWLMPYGDYGTMTFSLKGAATVTVNHSMIPGKGTESGTYFLDVDNKTLSLTDAGILHDAGRDACVDDWGSIRLLSLTENSMQLAVMRKGSCEGAALLVYNFVPKAE